MSPEELRFEEPKEVPINPRIVQQMAGATIKSFIDAAVELITNSDDSYRRLEEQGTETEGRIVISVSREKGGVCRHFEVRDCAEGMTREQLERAIEFAGETSGFMSGRTVRGLFGRGLKEAIIAMGEGTIATIRDGRLNVIKVWWDSRSRKPLYQLLTKEICNPTPAQIAVYGLEGERGTTVSINVTNDKIKLPECDKLKDQIACHYALRGITSSYRRTVRLNFNDLKRNLKRENIPVSFVPPPGDVVYEGTIQVGHYGDEVTLRVFKSPSPLESPGGQNPFARAGILIMTKAAVLDHRLFKYETDPAALYFFGEAYCEGIEKRIRQGELGIIDPNRYGLDWRHEYCQALQAAIEQVLKPLIEEKRKELDQPSKGQVTEQAAKLLRGLCDMLNKMANEEEFDELESNTGLLPRIESLTIVPPQANLEVNRPRTMSLYAPSSLVRRIGYAKAAVFSDNIQVQPLSTAVTLGRHPRYTDLYYGTFKLVGRALGQEATISCKLGEYHTTAYVKVSPLAHKRRGEKPHGTKGGFISRIEPDDTPNPIQRVEYVRDVGRIKLYVNFPGVTRYIHSGLQGVETEQGRVMLAELVAEAFCKALAVRELEQGRRPKMPGAEIDSYNAAINDLQRKYLGRIHEFIATYRFQ